MANYGGSSSSNVGQRADIRKPSQSVNKGYNVNKDYNYYRANANNHLPSNNNNNEFDTYDRNNRQSIYDN